MPVGGGRKRSTRKNKKVVKRGRKTVRSKTARKQRVKRTRSRRGGVGNCCIATGSAQCCQPLIPESQQNVY